jgi:hypothetical protein
MKLNNESDVFVDCDPKLFQHLIDQLRKESFKSISSSELLSTREKISFEGMLIDLNVFVFEPSGGKSVKHNLYSKHVLTFLVPHNFSEKSPT